MCAPLIPPPSYLLPLITSYRHGKKKIGLRKRKKIPVCSPTKKSPTPANHTNRIGLNTKPLVMHERLNRRHLKTLESATTYPAARKSSPQFLMRNSSKRLASDATAESVRIAGACSSEIGLTDSGFLSCCSFALASKIGFSCSANTPR